MRREKTSNRRGVSRSPRTTYHFRRSPQFDFFLQWLVGAQSSAAAEAGECFFAAGQIRDGDLESWVASWRSLAERTEARADECAAGGHAVSAREAHLRAYTYHRAPLLFMNPVTDQRYRGQLAQARRCFRAAIDLFEHPVEVLAVPFEHRTLPGYFFPPDDRREPAPTLLMVGGGDTVVEDLYGYIGPAALRRGYNLVTVDLPGQGDLPYAGMVMRPDSEAPVGAVLDQILTRPDVDAERLAAYGISGGGYLVPRAATRDHRIRACVATSVILDMSGIWGPKLASAESSILARAVLRLPLARIKTTLMLLETYKWRWGARSLTELHEVSKRFVLDPAAITCPLLNLVSQQEWEQNGAVAAWARSSQQAAQNPASRIVITPRDEGADSHAVGSNLSLMSQIVFDWLDDVFGQGASGPA